MSYEEDRPQGAPQDRVPPTYPTGPEVRPPPEPVATRGSGTMVAFFVIVALGFAVIFFSGGAEKAVVPDATLPTGSEPATPPVGSSPSTPPAVTPPSETPAAPTAPGNGAPATPPAGGTVPAN